MSVNLSIKDVPDELAARLRERAARHHRSLQGELMHIIETAVHAERVGTLPPDRAEGGAGRSWVQGSKSIEQLCAERQASGWRPHAALATAPLAVDIVRADRDAR